MLVIDDKVTKIMSYVGVGYRNGSFERELGYDCLTFILTLLREVFGRTALVNAICKSEYENMSYKIDWYLNPDSWTIYAEKIKEYCDLTPYVEGVEPKLYDLLFFSWYNDSERITHIGMYIGNGKFVHCAFTHGVIVTKLTYMKGKLLFYGREKENING